MAEPTRATPPEGVEIGPVAHHLLLENDDAKIWQVDTPAGETFWHHYHDLDYVLFHTTEMFAAVYHADEEHDRVWRARLESGETLDESLGGWCYEHTVNFIPGTGFLSPGYANIGDTRFTAALIELKRPRRPDQADVGFARCDALVGLPPRPGTTMLLENDRVRVFETWLAPGERTEPRRRLESAVYVIDGGRVRLHETPEGGTPGATDVVRENVEGCWLAPAADYSIENLGDAPYRELAVELK